MELLTERVESPALPSASVVLLRDVADDLEVFLLRRHGASDVLGGAHVFPGGKVDAEDAQLAQRLDVAPERLQALLAEPGLDASSAAALFTCAIREVFEESGVLFAPAEPAQVRTAWAALRAGAHFEQVIATIAPKLAASALVPWSRWITPTLPSVSRKRFDTRFFVAALPPGQQAAHDMHEATEGTWLTPRAALRRYWDNGIDLAPPQILGLAHLARHRCVASVLQEARSRTPPCIRPEPSDAQGVRTLCYPGDPGHTEPVQHLPGPTRLTYRNKRFEPEGGLAVLLGE